MAVHMTFRDNSRAISGADRELRRRGRRRRKMAAGATYLLIAETCLSVFLGCSSLPRNAEIISAKKKEALDYTELADGHFQTGDYIQALQFYAEALDVSLSVDHREGAIAARGSLGRVYLVLGRMEDAEREFTDALEDAIALGEPSLHSVSLVNMGEFLYARGDVAGAERLFLEAEPLAKNDEAGLAVIAHDLGIVAQSRGDLDSAEAYIQKAAASNEKAGRWVELGSNYYVLASISNARGDLVAAIERAQKALESDKKAENAPGIGADLEALAKLERRNGDAAAAFDLYRRAFGVRLGMNDLEGSARSLIALRELALELGKADYAERYDALLARLREE